MALFFRLIGPRRCGENNKGYGIFKEGL